MTRVHLSRAAADDLGQMIGVLSLPADTRDRVRRSLGVLSEFPLIGRSLSGRWSGLRFLIGPWSWMVFVYQYDPETDAVTVVTIQDSRGSAAAAHGR